MRTASFRVPDSDDRSAPGIPETVLSMHDSFWLYIVGKHRSMHRNVPAFIAPAPTANLEKPPR